MEYLNPGAISHLMLPNRIIRSATFEGMADAEGFITEQYISFYEKLSIQNIGAIICGFSYISPEGKAMQPGQAGVDSSDKIPLLSKLTETIHKNGSLIFMQIAHAGRQTLENVIQRKTISSSAVRSGYFKQRPEELSVSQAEEIIEKFGDAAAYCKQAGFDGIQLHAAHGYLVHQFILPAINKRKDKYGIDNQLKIGTRFLEEIIRNIRKKCGDSFPVLIKISGSDDLKPKFNKEQFNNLVRFLDQQPVDAIEISYGTMDYALNIFRGDIPVRLILKHNPFYKTTNKFSRFVFKTFLLPLFKYKTKAFSPVYNLEYALLARTHTTKPVICVGGFRKGKEIELALEKKIDFVSISRPFICEPDFIIRLKENPAYESKCTNCNYCAIMCDTSNNTQCYTNK